eukprot:TRINITY_DN12863_c0_g1_i1.p1 TRINITY_DN12863_c0_g1~~TRINITY_DN12863_c0_g1_i1.p1  ORF type:complete len:137 (-),score=10.19 TRINITY_DN12863_c0_g1_i1:140-505(-)
MSDKDVHCSGCGKSIESGSYFSVNNNHYHSKCWTCSQCQKPLTSEYHTKDEGYYCETCYFDVFGDMCKGCQKPIHGDSLSALDADWHRECLACSVCHVNLAGSDMWNVGGWPRCAKHNSDD